MRGGDTSMWIIRGVSGDLGSAAEGLDGGSAGWAGIRSADEGLQDQQSTGVSVGSEGGERGVELSLGV
jgi:hypothetical protein